MTDLMVPNKRARTLSFSEKHPEYSESHASAAEKEIAPVQVNNFLEICRFCKKKLRHDEDVFMYGFLGAFCSKECRTKQMACDIFKDFSRDKAQAKKGRTCVSKPKESKDEAFERITASSRFYI